METEIDPHSGREMSPLKNHQSLYVRLVKPVFDRTLAAIMLLALLPALLAIAVGIKLSSRGPILYSISVIGRRRKRFQLFKFRTMSDNWSKAKQDSFIGQIVSDAGHSANTEARVFKLSRDPRITAVGKFLRKYALDELPSLLNVLTGDLSLVGPRPTLSFEADHLNEEARFTVKPGLSGMWVLNIDRSSWEESVESDKYYVEHLRPSLDFKILARTFSTLLVPRGMN